MTSPVPNNAYFHMISDEVKIYIIVVANGEIENFVADNLFIEDHLIVQKIIINSLISITI